MARRFRLLVFDWDGTLVDSTAIIAAAIRSACSDVGEPVPDEATARYVIGLGLADALAHVAPGLARARHGELASRYRHHYLARDSEIPLFAGARDLLDELAKRGFRLAIATGKSRAGLDRALAMHALAPRFDATRCADEGMPKPHPEMLLWLMARLDIAAESTLMIGDTTHDLELAHAAGVASMAIAHGAHDPAGLTRAKPLVTVHTIAELQSWLFANA